MRVRWKPLELDVLCLLADGGLELGDQVGGRPAVLYLDAVPLARSPTVGAAGPGMIRTR